MSSVIVQRAVWPRVALAGSTVTDAEGTARRKALFFGGGSSAARAIRGKTANRATAAPARRISQVMQNLRASNEESRRLHFRRFNALQFERAHRFGFEIDHADAVGVG